MRQHIRVAVSEQSFGIGNLYAADDARSALYQTVYVIDYRYYSGSVSDFAKTNGVTDVIFINNLSAIRGSYQMGKLAGVK